MSTGPSVAAIREALADLPDDCPVAITDQWGRSYAIERVGAAGVTSDNPMLMLRINLLDHR